jgi:hypothetical protein
VGFYAGCTPKLIIFLQRHALSDIPGTEKNRPISGGSMLESPAPTLCLELQRARSHRADEGHDRRGVIVEWDIWARPPGVSRRSWTGKRRSPWLSAPAHRPWRPRRPSTSSTSSATSRPGTAQPERLHGHRPALAAHQPRATCGNRDKSQRRCNCGHAFGKSDC